MRSPEANRGWGAATWEASLCACWQMELSVTDWILEEYPNHQVRRPPSGAVTWPGEPHFAHDGRMSRQGRCCLPRRLYFYWRDSNLIAVEEVMKQCVMTVTCLSKWFSGVFGFISNISGKGKERNFLAVIRIMGILY